MILYFCKVKRSTELLNGGTIPDSSLSYSLLTPTPSFLDWVAHAGSEEPFGLPWAWAKEGHTCCRLHILPMCSPRVSMLLPELPKTGSPPARARLSQLTPRIPGSPSALCLTGFIPAFNVVFIPEHTGWSNRWVELESPMFQPGSVCWGCWRAARH